MLELISGIIIGILLSIVFYIAGDNKEQIVKRVKNSMIKNKGYIAGLNEEESSFQDSLKSDFKDIEIK